MRSLLEARTALKFAAGLAVVGGSVDTLHQSNSSKISSSGLVRFGRAAVAVAIVVADYKITLRGIDPQSEQYLQLRSKVHLRSAERLRDLCWRNGGCFIKVGQHIGALEYLMPREYVDTMKVLHRDGPRTSLPDLRQVIKVDFGRDIDELFSSFDEVPVASASLAQVHRATRRSDGQVVAVKVQHPNVRVHSSVDMATMELLVAIVERIFPDFQFTWLAEETRKNLPLELDFVHEAGNCEKVAQRFQHLKFLKVTKVPTVDWSLTSPRVLTMEFCDGGFITDHSYMQKHKINIEEVLSKLGHLYSEMIFVQGYIHCDPHPGNLLVKNTKNNGVEIVLLDHGLYQTLSDDIRMDYCRLWQSILHADKDAMKRHASRFNIDRLYPLFACIVTGRSWEAISHGIHKLPRTAAETMHIRTSATGYIPEITSILNSIPRQLLLVFKTNDLIRGIEASLRDAANPEHHQHARTAFLSMARCCVRAVCAEQTLLCGSSRRCRWRCAAEKHWLLLKLSVYETSLRLADWFRKWIPRLKHSAQNVELTFTTKLESIVNGQ